MKKLLVMVLALLATGCTNSAAIRTCNAEFIKENIDSSKVTVVDVRDNSEFISGHIPGAINIPVNDIKSIADYVVDENDIIIVYCRSGVRSRKAALTLVNLGYKNVYDFGGIDNWEYDLEMGDSDVSDD